MSRIKRVRIRATVFPITVDGSQISVHAWRAFVNQSMRRANEIFAPAEIQFSLSNFRPVNEERGMEILRENLAGELRRGIRTGRYPEGFTIDDVARGERLSYISSSNATRGTEWSQLSVFGNNIVRYETIDSEATRRGKQATGEALRILSLNRRRRQVATYWVPAFNNAEHGVAIIGPEVFNNVTSRNEGIFIRYHTVNDILAHELGHLLMHGGHCSFEGPYPGDPERDIAPIENLMHGNAAERTGTQLTDGQITRLEEYGERYFR